MTDRDHLIIQKFLALDMWLNHWKSALFCEYKEEAEKSHERVLKALKDCEELE